MSAPAPSPTDPRRILALWWPLATSWMLMAAEAPMFTALVARMAEPESALAAYGSLVLPLALVIESPVIMLLAASTALSTSREAYARLGRFTLLLGLALSAVHIVVAFTPLFDLIATRWIGVPSSVLEPGRIGLRILTPWTLSIAWRRYQQGLLIRFGRSRLVGLGTFVRLCANAGTLLVGYSYGALPGIVVGTLGISVGVITEALFIHASCRSVARDHLSPAGPGAQPLSWRAFLHFYVPLAMTPLMTLAIQPIGAAAMSRMPEALPSLAAWPAVHGSVFLLRSVGLAFNEVVVSLGGDSQSLRALKRVTWVAALLLVASMLLFAASPISEFWFSGISGLSPELVRLCRIAVLLALLMPGYQMLQSLYTGALVRAHQTRAVTEAVAIYATTSALALLLGVHLSDWPGIFVAVLSFSCAGVMQTLWLWWRSRELLAT